MSNATGEAHADWSDLTPDRLNANKGTIRGGGMLDVSLEENGAGRGILIDGAGNIIAGNKTAEAAARKGFRLKVVPIEPDEILAGQRVDLNLYDEENPTARNLATADNRVAQANLDWEHEALKAAEAAGSTALATFWHPQEREAMAIAAATEAQRQEADAEDEQEPLTPPRQPPVSKPIVIVECRDENEQAAVIDLCDERGLRWRTP